MSFNPIKLALGLIAVFALNSQAENLFTGDSSAEAEADTLTRGNYSSGLLPFAWDAKEAYDGKKSVRVDWDRKMRFITTDNKRPHTNWFDKWISTAGSPDLIAGETYTFSFYAKASEDNYLFSVSMLPSAGWDFYEKGGNADKSFKLSREWKRYSISFTAKMKENAPVKGYTAIFDFRNSPAGSVWYDALQLEKGSEASPYINPSQMSAGVTLNSSDWSNIYFPEDPVIATVHIAMPPGKAELQCKVTDYQGNIIKSVKHAVSGSADITIPLDNPRLGWFKVSAELSAGGKIISSHFANYIKIAKPLDIAPEIQPFAGIVNENGFNHFSILKKIGVKRTEVTARWGNCSYAGGIETEPGKFDWSAFEWHLKRGKEAGMLNKVLANPFDIPQWYLDKDELAKVKKMINREWLVLDSSKHEHWRKFIGELTRRYGDMIDEFELGAEDNGRLGVNEYYISLYPQEVKKSSVGKPFICGGKPFDDLCAMVKIGAEEIRKTHPNIKIGAIRPSKSSDPDDLLFTKEMFKKIGKDFNIFPVDFYFYPFDCGPDIKDKRGKSDELIAIYNTAKKITEEYGCNQPIYMSEFGWAIDTRYPDDSIYRQEQAETMPKDYITARAAGYYAFDWYQGFGGVSVGKYTFPMSQNMRLQPIAAAYSSAARVVENVTESKWLAPDKDTRIAIMRKHDGKGAAAVWSEKGYKLSLPAKLSSDVTDLMGNNIQPVSGQFSLSPAPIYIWHTDYKELADALSKADIEMTEFCAIKFRMLTESAGRVQFVNLSNASSLDLSAEITVGGKTFSQTVDVAKGSDNSCDIALSGKDVKVKVSAAGKKTAMEKAFELDALTPVPRGSDASGLIASPNSRNDVIPPDPWVSWDGPDDLSAKISASWDENSLYIKAVVKDDKHFSKPSQAPWNADSVQIAIDPKNDGAFFVPSPGKKLGSDDFEFGLALGDDGKKRCLFAFGKDICGGDNYTIVRDEKEKTTTYSLRLAWKDLGVKPSAGMVFGMSFVIFDDDTGNGQNYFMPAGGGVAGVKNPALYKKIVLKN